MPSDNYWNRMYGSRSNEFIEGIIIGISYFAIWKDGIEIVGIREEPLKQIIQEVKKGLGWKNKEEG